MGLVNIRNATILVVENDEELRKTLCTILEKARFSKVIAENTATGAIAKMKSTKVDALLVNWTLPDIPGAQLIPAIRAGNKKLPIVAIGPEAETPTSAEAKSSGASCSLHAPIVEQRLLKVLDEFMLARLGIQSSSVVTKDVE